MDGTETNACVTFVIVKNKVLAMAVTFTAPYKRKNHWPSVFFSSAFIKRNLSFILVYEVFFSFKN